MVFDADIPFNAIDFAYYQPMINVVAYCGLGFKGASFHDIKGPLYKMRSKE
jgi:hypothetical protein